MNRQRLVLTSNLLFLLLDFLQLFHVGLSLLLTDGVGQLSYAFAHHQCLRRAPSLLQSIIFVIKQCLDIEVDDWFAIGAHDGVGLVEQADSLIITLRHRQVDTYCSLVKRTKVFELLVFVEKGFGLLFLTISSIDHRLADDYVVTALLFRPVWCVGTAYHTIQGRVHFRYQGQRLFRHLVFYI